MSPYWLETANIRKKKKKKKKKKKMGRTKHKVPSSMRKICGFTSSCTCAKHHQGICSPLTHSTVSNCTFCGQRRQRSPWSDCANWRQCAWNVKTSFLEKNKKNISICCLLLILPRVLSVSDQYIQVNFIIPNSIRIIQILWLQNYGTPEGTFPTNI